MRCLATKMTEALDAEVARKEGMGKQFLERLRKLTREKYPANEGE